MWTWVYTAVNWLERLCLHVLEVMEVLYTTLLLASLGASCAGQMLPPADPSSLHFVLLTTAAEAEEGREGGMVSDACCSDVLAAVQLAVDNVNGDYTVLSDYNLTFTHDSSSQVSVLLQSRAASCW